MDKSKENVEKLTETMQSIVDCLGCPYRVLPRDLTPEEILAVYEEALEQGRRDGFVPVIMPEDWLFARDMKDIFENAPGQAEELAKQVENNGGLLLKEKTAFFDKPWEDDGSGFGPEELLGEMENGEAVNTFSRQIDYSTREAAQQVLLELPAKNPWEAVIYIPFGGWNECPEPLEMAAVCKYWYEKYGAVPAVITHDTLEMLLPEPVSEDEAMETAKEHFAFCEDRVFQGTETCTVGELADGLRQSRVWYFWWD